MDTVSREDVLYFQFDPRNHTFNEYSGNVVSVDDINDIKSRTATWLAFSENSKYHRCSHCGEVNLFSRDGRKVLSKFCPYCGYFMKGEKYDG